MFWSCPCNLRSLGLFRLPDLSARSAEPCSALPPASRIGSSKGSRHWKTTPGTALHHLWPPERSLQIPSGGRRATACDWNLGMQPSGHHWPNSLTHPQESSKAWLSTATSANRAWWMLGLCSMFLSLLIWRGNICCTLSASSRTQSRSLGCRFSSRKSSTIFHIRSWQSHQRSILQNGRWGAQKPAETLSISLSQLYFHRALGSPGSAKAEATSAWALDLFRPFLEQMNQGKNHVGSTSGKASLSQKPFGDYV